MANLIRHLSKRLNPVAAAVVSAFVLAGCDKAPAPQSTAAPQPAVAPSVVSATVNGRTVRATIAGDVNIRQEGDAVVVTTEKHKFIVEPERFLIDGVELLKLRRTVKFVEFYLTVEQYFTMNADMAGVAGKQLPSANPYRKQQGGGATRFDDRTVHYSAFGDSTISPEGDAAVITTETHRIVVERERVTLDGTEVHRMSPTAKDVRVLLTETGRFEIQVDGSTELSKQISK